METINKYLNILKEFLLLFDVSEDYSFEIIESIRIRMISLLLHWNDEAFRKAVLFVGQEEGEHYSPKVSNADVAPFVVVTTRNSLFETIASVDFKNAGLQRPISNTQIKIITSETIKYFSDVNFSKLSEEMYIDDDYFGDIAKKYPCAFLTFKAITFSADLQISYRTPTFKPSTLPKSLIDHSSDTILKDNLVAIKQSGITNSIDSGLYAQLKKIANGELNVFYADSIKSITRNFEKLLMIFEYVLTRKAAIVTANYLFENGHVEKREKLIKPLSEAYDIKRNIVRLNELSRNHRDIMESILIQCKGS